MLSRAKWPCRVDRQVEKNSVCIVYQDSGVDDGTGRIWLPLPIARIPIGAGRTYEQAVALAELIADAMDAAHAGGHLP